MAVYRRLGANQPYHAAPSSEYSESLVGSIHFGDLNEVDFDPLHIKTDTSVGGGSQGPTEGSSPAGSDSGVSELSSQNGGYTQEQCALIHRALCTQMDTVTQSAIVMVKQVHAEDSADKAKQLLKQLETEMHPQLIRLDVDLGRAERQLRHTLDRARIGEHRITWLLEFNKCELQLRDVFSALVNTVYVQLEHILRVRERGCKGMAISPQTSALLTQLHNTMHNTHAICDKAMRMQ